MVLDFKVHEQTLEGVPTTSVPRDKSQNYIKLRFHFDKSWDLFKEQGAHITVYCQDKKASPAVSTPTIIYAEDDWTLTLQDYYANLDDFLIMVVGVNADASVSCPTNALCVTLDKSGTAWTLNPQTPEDPAYVQLLAEVNAEIAEVEGDLAKKENAFINIQEYYDSWIAEHPSGDVEDFIKTIADVGKYKFSDYESEYYYELKDAAQSDEGHSYYGTLDIYDGGTTAITRKAYFGDTVAGLSRVTDIELADKKYVAEHGAEIPMADSDTLGGIKAAARDASTDTQEVKIDTASGKLYTAPGGSGGTSDHRQLTNRDAAEQHPISAITGLQDALADKLGLGGNTSITAMRGDLYMGSHAIHNVADANPVYNYDAVNVKFMRDNIPAATSSKFGGIKAEAKAASDTVPVRIGADGQAYVAGGAGEIFWVNRTDDPETSTNYADVKTAYQAGKLIMCRYNTLEYEMTKASNASNPVFTFVAPISPDINRFVFNSSGDFIDTGFTMQSVANLVTSLSAMSTDEQYPSAKCVYDAIHAAIGDTASALTALDNLIGGDTE